MTPDNLRMSDTQQVCMFVEYLKKKQTMQKNILRIDLSIMELYELYTSSSLLRKKSYDKLVEIRNAKALNDEYFKSYNKAHELADNLYHDIYRKLCDAINEGKPIAEHLIKQKVQDFIIQNA